MTSRQLQTFVIEALDEFKARDVRVFDVADQTPVTDTMIVASSTSSRHLHAIADKLVDKARRAGHKPLGVEGAGSSDWVLVDLADVIVHVMLPQARGFYNLEKLWSVDGNRAVAGGH